MDKQNIVLLGAGHANCLVIKMIQEYQQKIKNYNIIIVTDQPFSYYSGMLPGYIAKEYTLDQITIDVKVLAEKFQIQYIIKPVKRLNPKTNQLIFDDDSTLNYDVLSVNIGSRTLNSGSLEGANKLQIQSLLSRVEIDQQIQLKEEYLLRQNIIPNLIICGGGLAGIELSFAIRQRWNKVFNQNFKITLITSQKQLLIQQSKGGQKYIFDLLQQKNINVVLDTRIIDIQEDHVLGINNQKEVKYFGNTFIWSTGAQSQSIFKDSGLQTDHLGFMFVNDFLQNIDFPNIFGAGDCIKMQNYNIPKAGVYAVREAPIITKNIIAFINKNALNQYIPQQHILQIINICDKSAILQKYGNSSIKTYIGWLYKDSIDRKFMKQFQVQ